MLVLLAMVLSISTFIATGEIKINLPTSQTASSTQQNQDPLLIQVDAAGTFFQDGKETSIEDIAATIESLDRNKPVLLRMDKDSRFESFIRVIDLLKEHRHENFSIAAERPQG